MDASLFSPINTSISVRETKMLTKDEFDRLLQAPDQETMALVLQQTDYHLDKEVLSDPDRIENALVTQLGKEYAFAFAESPQPEVVQLFALRYTYHNLKVFLKARAIQTDLSHLLIPIGAYSKEVLSHLVTTLTSDICPILMQEEVRATWLEYQDYQDIRVLDVGMDMAFFKHLKTLAQSLNQDILSQYVALTIDFYNVITVKRGLSLIHI